MRRAIVALFAVICGILFPHFASCADYVSGDVYGGLVHFDQDVYIPKDVVVAADAVYADSSLNMVNTAFIRSDIYVCDNCDFRIQNSGNISGSIHLGNGAVMTQIVRSDADVTFLDVDAPYIVLADGANDVSWNDLSLLGANAGTLVLRDSGVVFSNTGLALTYKGGQTSKIFLDGVITLRLPQDYCVHSGIPLMRNVYGAVDIVITGASPGELFAYVAKIENDDLYVKTVRETDYYKILGDERGYFLNLVRENYPDDALLRRLDSAQNMTELNAIMSRSIALNPMMLAQPMLVLDKFMSADMAVSGVCA
ncbi:MAG: hypothetical protein K2I81_02125, partial [Alphaproteobacteria bacterium]|nr:hypothetical protein [Alphaproteobacteria bacterium]